MSLSCKEAEPLLHLLADGEVAPEDQISLEEHLSRCDGCSERLASLRALKGALKRSAAAEQPVPEALVARLQGQIAYAARGERRRRTVVVAAPAFAAAGALFFVGATLAGALLVKEGVPTLGADAASAPPLLEETLSLHTLDVPVDVASPDPARVSAFLSARIGHPVRVPRLDTAGLGLAGARVINVDNQRAAQLFYEGGIGRRVSLMAVPDPDGRLTARVRGDVASSTTSSASFAGWIKSAPDDESAHLRARRGDLAVHVWSDAGNVYSLAGTLDDERLDSLVRAVTSPSHVVRRVARDFDPPLR